LPRISMGSRPLALLRPEKPQPQPPEESRDHAEKGPEPGEAAPVVPLRRVGDVPERAEAGDRDAEADQREHRGEDYGHSHGDLQNASWVNPKPFAAARSNEPAVGGEVLHDATWPFPAIPSYEARRPHPTWRGAR